MIKTRMFSLTTFNQHSTGNPNQSNEARKGNKGHPNQKGKFLFSDDIILYIGNPKESTKTVRTNERIQQSCSIQNSYTKVSCISICQQ